MSISRVRTTIKQLVSDTIKDYVQNNVYISVPARIVSTKNYESLQCVDVQILINDLYFYKNNTVLKQGVLKNIFVKLQSSGGFNIKLPVNVGDLCTLHYSDKDLSTFLAGKGDSVDVDIESIPELNDCFVELGFGTRNNHQNPSETDLIIEGDNTTITITPSGNVTVNTAGTSYLKSANHTIDTNMTVTGNLTVNGNTEIGGTTKSTGLITGEAGVQAPSYSGVGGSGGSMTIGDATITGDATIGGISYKGHVHTEQGDGADTSPPK